ncbi:MAG TPA: sigma-70 family RNA polymerase sigma factor [Thermoanaerobaculia bacterium]|nr:sigma-70 family RNA polymerase sigma factor [Thermoanaerobaculia bacterium]
MTKILIVDDEESITDGLRALFELEDMPADGAYDRRSAEELMEGNDYGVILADVRLQTEEEGLTLLDSIRRKSPNSRIASLTGYATPQLEQELLRRGSSVVLRKPMEFEAIVAAVTEMIAEIERVVSDGAEGHADVEQLYHEVRRILYAIPQRRYGFTAEETEELVQEAWILFLEKQGSVTRPKPWLAGTIVNLCKQQIYRNARTRERGRELTSPDENVIGVNGTSHIDVMMMQQALASLDERSRLLCTMIGLEGAPYDEVSEELGIPIGSVGPLYMRAKARLRNALDRSN